MSKVSEYLGSVRPEICQGYGFLQEDFIAGKESSKSSREYNHDLMCEADNA